MTPMLKASLLSVVASVCLTAGGQSYTAKKIVFKHAGGFTQAQLEAASGFHAGMSFTKDAMSAGAQKLADTGRFANVGAYVEGTAAAYSVVFDLTPLGPADFLPVGFENFLWLTPAEVKSAIVAKLPLYNGTVLEGGSEPDDVNQALVAALEAKGVHARVGHDTVEPTLEHPRRVMEFRVQKPATVVANVKLTGVTPELAPLLQKSVNLTAHTLYNDADAGFVTRESILRPLLDAGYAQASLDGMTAEAGDAGANGNLPVVVSATLAAKEVYRVKAIVYAGTPMLSADEFAKKQTLHAGDVASRKELLLTLKPLDDAYRSKGYMDVMVNAKPTFDEAAKTVEYAVTVMPGEVYRVKSVTPVGLDDAGKADFAKYFTMKEGEPYNPVYVGKFIENNSAVSSLTPYSGSFQAVAQPSTHTVDVTIKFFRSGKGLEQKIIVR